jgi:hypothetical protein
MNTSTFSLALVSLFAALIAVFGLIPKIDLPLGVPITLQTLGVMLAGCMLGPNTAIKAANSETKAKEKVEVFMNPAISGANVDARYQPHALR